MTRPPLVLVTGMPASGKTTLSAELARRLYLPLVAKDAIKESLCRAHGMPADRAESMRLGIKSIRVMHDVTALHLERGAGLVLESAFVPGISEPEVAVHLDRSVAVNVHCTLDVAVALARYEARSATGARHASHHDGAVLSETGIETWPERYGRMEVGIPVLEVDTNDGYDPSVDAIVEWVEERI